MSNYIGYTSKRLRNKNQPSSENLLLWLSSCAGMKYNIEIKVTVIQNNSQNFRKLLK